ncbi:MAG: bifunctional adenosylcobinamide kinase/adenosylcobinamide-phosphate guanylyltransferase [Methylococcaceae bacterium]|nr:bifunctional adenosylcobinamide kinase/adenosylcobinamide-phosphate guanylyltransferase [Methylococcaceae bacterium]
MIELVLGGARSGKSRYAEQVANESGIPVIYIATAEAGDAEMQVRIEKHRQDRPEHWKTIEEPIKLADVIQQYSSSNSCLLVDCLTLWLTNILFDKQGKEQQSLFERESQALFKVLDVFSGQLVMVSNEVGLGIVPIDKMTRRFVDEVGLLHQKIVSYSDKVVLVTVGLPQILK